VSAAAAATAVAAVFVLLLCLHLCPLLLSCLLGSDSHSKTYFLALQCFLYDFWAPNVCQPSTDAAAVDSLLKLPLREGNANCIHLRGAGGGRICMVEAVLGSSLINNPEVGRWAKCKGFTTSHCSGFKCAAWCHYSDCCDVQQAWLYQLQQVTSAGWQYNSRKAVQQQGGSTKARRQYKSKAAVQQQGGSTTAGRQ
jgi:hypothetical protein